MYDTIAQIRAANEAAGHYWFSPSTLRFFNSRVQPHVYGGRYFVTSERYDNSTPRRYTVRVANDDGSIDTVGEFQQYATSGEAQRAAHRIAQVAAAA